MGVSDRANKGKPDDRHLKKKRDVADARKSRTRQKQEEVLARIRVSAATPPFCVFIVCDRRASRARILADRSLFCRVDRVSQAPAWGRRRRGRRLCRAQFTTFFSRPSMQGRTFFFREPAGPAHKGPDKSGGRPQQKVECKEKCCRSCVRSAKQPHAKKETLEFKKHIFFLF